MRQALATVAELLDVTLFHVASTPITLSTLLIAVTTIVVSRLISSGLQRVSARTLKIRGVEHGGTVAGMQRLVHYVVMFIGTGIALDTLGINLGTLFAAGAIFAVGLGFAMQNIAQNFVSGVLLLLERSIKPGDILEVEGQVVRIEQMGIRSTVARARDEHELIIPNSILVQSTVKNFTLRDSVFRLRCQVGVVYGSDLRLVREVLEKAAHALEWRLTEREPRVLLSGFGSSSVDYDISVWMDNPWNAPHRLSLLNEAVWWALKEAGIVIAFPQLDLHLDPGVERALLALQPAAAAAPAGGR